MSKAKSWKSARQSQKKIAALSGCATPRSIKTTRSCRHSLETFWCRGERRQADVPVQNSIDPEHSPHAVHDDTRICEFRAELLSFDCNRPRPLGRVMSASSLLCPFTIHHYELRR